MVGSDIKRELSNLKEGQIILIKTDADKALKTGLYSIKTLISKKYTCIILSASRPCSNLLELYSKNGIDSKKVFILDTVCKSQGLKSKDGPNISHVENASDLTSISISLNELMRSIKGKKFIFIDSINSMLIYNSPQIFSKFIYSISANMRICLTSGLLIILKDDNSKKVYNEIAQLCDKIITV